MAAVREEERGGWLGLADVKSFSRVRLFVTPWTVVYQAPPSTRYSRQEYWSGLPLPSPGDLPDPGIEPGSPMLQPYSLPSEPPGKPTVGIRYWRKEEFNILMIKS